MSRVYEARVDGEHRGDIIADSKAHARRIGAGSLWTRGEEPVIRLLAIRPKRQPGKTRRPNWRTKTRELRRRDGEET